MVYLYVESGVLSHCSLIRAHVLSFIYCLMYLLSTVIMYIVQVAKYKTTQSINVRNVSNMFITHHARQSPAGWGCGWGCGWGGVALIQDARRRT